MGAGRGDTEGGCLVIGDAFVPSVLFRTRSFSSVTTDKCSSPAILILQSLRAQ